MNARTVITQRTVSVTRCQYDRCSRRVVIVLVLRRIHVDDSARYRDSGSDVVQLGNLWRYRFLECLQLVVRDDGNLVWHI